ncbi:DUF1761 domain-containing protein [Sphingomonas sp.]|uniref:DUF1761 domain-containing protein n=1 Tax=Sphingomonas sp. TaxID=28214 RepID=UPI0038ACE37E
MPQVNLVAVLVCGVASLALGAIWYSPFLFAKAWQRAAGLSDEQAKSGNMAVIFGLTFVLSLIAAYVFGMFLGHSMPLAGSVGAGFAAGLCWVAASFGINYLFERRPLGLWLINGGYHTLQFTLFGLILGLMH